MIVLPKQSGLKSTIPERKKDFRGDNYKQPPLGDICQP